MPTWKIPPLLHPPLLLHPPPLDPLPLLHPPLLDPPPPHPLNVPTWLNNPPGTKIGSVMIANAWVWIVARKSKRLGEMAKGAMENGTMLDVSMMEVIAASGQIAKSAKMNLLFSKLQLNN